MTGLRHILCAATEDEIRFSGSVAELDLPWRGRQKARARRSH
jgi:hypothetical protein